MAIMNTSNPAELAFRDAGNEIGRFRIFGADITVDNLDEQEAKWEALITNITAPLTGVPLVLGALVSQRYVNDTTFTYVLPTNGSARELKLLIQYVTTTTGKRHTTTLPTLNPVAVTYVANINAKDIVRVDVPANIAAFITLFNGFAVDPDDNTLATTVIGLKVVGRNN